jgi:hypothetical protein
MVISINIGVFVAPLAPIVAIGLSCLFILLGIILLLKGIIKAAIITKDDDAGTIALIGRNTIIGTGYLVGAVLLLANPSSAIILPLMISIALLDLVLPTTEQIIIDNLTGDNSKLFLTHKSQESRIKNISDSSNRV